MITQKCCRTCREWKPLDDFYQTKYKRKTDGKVTMMPKPDCKPCERKASAIRMEARRERLKREGRYSEIRRVEGEKYRKKLKENAERWEQIKARNREYQATKRREKGMRAIGPWKKYRDLGRNMLPIEPISKWLNEQIADGEKVTIISQRTGIDDAILRRIFTKEEKGQPRNFVTEDIVDKILTGMDEQHLWHDLYPVE